jgi:hypothetical protein
MGKCHVKLITQPRTQVFLLDDNDYVVSSFGETLTTRCVGKSAVQTSLPKGVHLLHVNHSCTIFGQEWSLSSIIQKSLRIHTVIHQLARSRPLNLSAILSPIVASRPTGSTGSYPTLAAVEPLPLDVWMAPAIQAPHWRTTTPTWIWVMLVFGILAAGLLAAYCLFIRYRCGMITRGLHWWQHGKIRPRAKPGRTGRAKRANTNSGIIAIPSPRMDPGLHEVLMTSLGVGPHS